MHTLSAGQWQTCGFEWAVVLLQLDVLLAGTRYNDRESECGSREAREDPSGKAEEASSWSWPTAHPSGMKGRISSGFKSDSSRGRSTWKSWTWGGPGWALGAAPPGR